MWDYVFFVGYIMDKPRFEYTSTEAYVYEMVTKGDNDWIPHYEGDEEDKEEDDE